MSSARAASTVRCPGNATPRPPRILVCDDEAHILYAIAFKLSAAGFEVIQASNGRHAIGLLESVTPDLVITDYQMPEVDGLELCRYLRSRPDTVSVPILLLTAKAMELNEEKVKQDWGVMSVFMKPFSPRALLQTVQTTLQAAKTVAVVSERA